MDFMDLFTMFNVSVGPKEESEKETKDYSKYLKKEERLKTLLKEKEVKDFVENPILKRLARFCKQDTYDFKYSVKKALGQEMAEHLIAEVGREGKDIISFFMEHFPHIYAPCRMVDGEYGEKVLKAMTEKKKGEYLKTFALQFFGKLHGEGDTKEEMFFPIGTSLGGRQNGREYRLRITKKFVYVGDVARYLAVPYLYAILKKELLRMRGEMGQVTPAHLFLMDQADKILKPAIQDGKLYVKADHLGLLSKSAIQWLSVTYKVEIVNTMDMAIKPKGEILSRKDLWPLFFLFEDYHLFLGRYMSYYKKNERWTVFGLNDPTGLYELARMILSEYEQEEKEFHLRKKMATQYATAYITKKNIPQYILKEMEESPFNDIFGFVEMDEECDTAVVGSLYDEYRAIADYIHLGQYKQCALRFRKLGKHHAAGLYYYNLRCLCVDPRHPDSFVHETMHMVDFENGNLSRTAKFSRIVEEYRRLVSGKVKSEKVELKGKYNLDYYFDRSEIFARCGEIFLSRICQVANSCLKPDTDCNFAYPEGDYLEKMIEEYYGELFDIKLQHLTVKPKMAS